MPEHAEQSIVRSGRPGRRTRDEECIQHEEDLDDIVKDVTKMKVDVGKNAGRLTAMLWFLAVIGGSLGIGLTVTITMLVGIQSSLNTSQVTMMQHSEQISSIKNIEIPAIKADIKSMQDRHTWEDQQKQLGR